VSSTFGRRKGKFQDFHFDKVLGTGATNEDVTRFVGPPIKNKIMEGVNVTVIAYGQTASGKTHTISGSQEEPGIIPTMISELMDEENDLEFDVRFGEVYMSKLYDLTKKNPEPIASINKWKYKKLVDSNPEKLLSRFNKWDSKRTTSGTNMNARSSRSHAIFCIQVTRTIGSKKTCGCLTVVDLAGSENMKKTNARGKQIQEAADVNKSLLFLKNVIRALGNGKTAHGWRNHMLGEVLKPSLTQNDATPKCLIITCLDPSKAQAIETKSSLIFAKSCKEVKISAKINLIEIQKDMAGLAALLEQQKKEREKERDEQAKSNAEQLKREKSRVEDQRKYQIEMAEKQQTFQQTFQKNQQTFQQNLVKEMKSQQIDGMKQITKLFWQLQTQGSHPPAPQPVKPEVKESSPEERPAFENPVGDDLEESAVSVPKKRSRSSPPSPMSIQPSKKLRRSFHYMVGSIESYEVKDKRLYFKIKYRGSIESATVLCGDLDEGDLKRDFFKHHPELGKYNVVDVPVEKIIEHRWGSYKDDSEPGLYYYVKYVGGGNSWVSETELRSGAMKDNYDLRHLDIVDHLGFDFS